MEAERRIDAGTLRSDQVITIQAEDLTGEGSTYEAGTDVTVEQALEAMTTASDNGTALALWRLLGDDAIRSALVRAGIPEFRLDIVGATMATPRAIGAIFTRLARRELVSRAASERMVARLQRQSINDRLPAGLPAGVVVAHKTGNLPGLTHDAGIIVTPAGPRIVVVMTWDSDEGAANTLIADIGAAVYRAATAR
jgi:beta-lactamase class A